MAHDCGEQEECQYQLKYGEQVVGVRYGIGKVAHQCHDFGAEIKGLQILFKIGRLRRFVAVDLLRQIHGAQLLVYKVLGQMTRQQIGEAGVPVEYGKQVIHHHNRAQHVRIVGVSLRSVEEGKKLVHFDEAKHAEYGRERHAQVEYVQRHQTQTVDVEAGRVHVVVPQADRVRLQHALLKETGPEVKQYITKV